MELARQKRTRVKIAKQLELSYFSGINDFLVISVLYVSQELLEL